MYRWWWAGLGGYRGKGLQRNHPACQEDHGQDPVSTRSSSQSSNSVKHARHDVFDESMSVFSVIRLKQSLPHLQGTPFLYQLCILYCITRSMCSISTGCQVCFGTVVAWHHMVPFVCVSLLPHASFLCPFREELHAEALARMVASNPANFGPKKYCLKECMCEVEGQVPCPGLVPLPKEMTGKFKAQMRAAESWRSRDACMDWTCTFFFIYNKGLQNTGTCRGMLFQKETFHVRL